jgi:hypothetical protein
LVIVIPIFLFSAVGWSYMISGPFADSKELGAVTPVEFGWSAAAFIYWILSVGLLVVSLLLKVVKKLTRRVMLGAVVCISFALGLWLGPGWGLGFKPLESVLGVITQSLIAFLLLGAVSVAWCRLALRGPKEQKRTSET